MTNPTLADMLSILADSITESGTWTEGFLPDTANAIGNEIELAHNVELRIASLRGMDPFERKAIWNRPSYMCADMAWEVTCQVSEVIADIDGCLFRLANSGYAHRF